ncbi:MAG TPA: ATP-binding protein [Verrucomicrobiales bacterium]|nr:ATP-binding protein [Verrucomicrobiales bacterium]
MTTPDPAAIRDSDAPPAGATLSAEQLIRHMGHDFNNLFSIILGGLSLLREEIPQDSWPPEAREVYTDVVSATREAAEVIAQLTAWAARQAIEPENADLNAFARELQRVLTPSLPAGVRLEVQLHDTPVMAWVDRARLHDAVLALIANACDAIGDAGTLCIETAAADGPALAVCDDGRGMDATTLARCRDPYFSGHGGVAHRGLGLSVVDGFVRASDGTLRIASAPGSGTRVSLAFPPSRSPR